MRKEGFINSRELAICCAKIADAKKGENILVLDVGEVSAITSYFMICTGRMDRHVRAIRDEVIEKLKKEHVGCYHRDGDNDTRWVVLDYIDVIVHIFDPEKRDYYKLEDLWGDAEEVEWRV